MDLMDGDYELTDDKTRMELTAIHELLAATYWAANRPFDVTQRAVAHSVCLGIFHAGKLVGFARAVTDEATLAYLCDVVVAPEHRGRGLGKWLTRCLLDHPRLQTATQILRTKDAQGLYTPFGFKPADCLRRSIHPD